VAELLLDARRSLFLFQRLAGARMRSDLQYRVSFALRLVGQILVTALDFAAIAIIFHQVPRLAGWRLEEVALLYGINGCAFALADLFTGSIERVNIYIRTGQLDQVLVRPASSLLLLVGDDFAIRRVGKLVQSSAVLVIAILALDRAWSVPDFAHIGLAIASGAAIFGGVFVLSGAAIFWLVEGREVLNSAIYGGHFLSQYPIGIYSRWLQRAIVFVLPIAFVAYVPDGSLGVTSGGCP
jgi:ABC-2 type transport system permease protein